MRTSTRIPQPRGDRHRRDSRARIVGWQVANHHTTSLILEALREAVRRTGTTRAYFHSAVSTSPAHIRPWLAHQVTTLSPVLIDPRPGESLGSVVRGALATTRRCIVLVIAPQRNGPISLQTKPLNEDFYSWSRFRRRVRLPRSGMRQIRVASHRKTRR